MLLPVSIVLWKNDKMDNGNVAVLLKMAWHDWLFFALAAIGVTLEAVADYQKSVFKEQPGCRELWIQTGVWRYSRHPNYFGEILTWIAIFAFCAPVLRGAEWVAVVSPAFITLLLLFVSGVPLIEAKYVVKFEKAFVIGMREALHIDSAVE